MRIPRGAVSKAIGGAAAAAARNPASRLEAHGYGKTRPAVPDDSAAKRAKKRRIEMTVQKQ